MILVDDIRKFIEREGLLDRDGARVGVALSGGADSVALLAVLVHLGYECVALHCNFHLRGAESDRDENHACVTAKALGVDIEVTDFDVASHRALHGGSVEMACRDLRYNWFKEMAARLNLQAVAVGHHVEDNVETLLINLLRGAGVRGLKGMLPRNGIFVRPLLETTREDLLRYLKECRLDYVVDSSNLADDYLRNRIRHRVLPAIQGVSGNYLTSIRQSLRNLREQSAMLDRLRKDYVAKYVGKDGSVDLSSIFDNEENPSGCLYELLWAEGFNLQQVEDIMRDHGRAGCLYNVGTDVWELHKGVLSRYNVDDSHALSFDPRRGCAEAGIAAEMVEISPGSKIAVGKNEMILDASVLERPGAWQLRRWREGDRIKPYGMRGTKLLSDVYSDAHLSLADKRRQWVMTHGEEVIWAVGLRAAAYYPVTAKTGLAIKFIYRGDKATP